MSVAEAQAALAAAVSHLHAHTHIAGAVVACLVLGAVQRWRARGKKAKGGRRKRRTSIGSTRLMLSGVIPNDGNYDAIINLRVDFKKGLPATAEVIRQLEAGIAPFVPFHSVPAQPRVGGDYSWRDAQLNVAKHVHEESIPSHDIATRVDAIINSLLRSRREGRPWWEVYLLRDEMCNGVMLIRIHHALGDGVSLMEMFADCITDAHGAALDLSGVFSPKRSGAAGAGKASFARRAVSWLRTPLVLLDIARSVFKVAGAAAVGCDTYCSFNNKSRLLPYQNTRFTVYFPSHSLALLKEIKTRMARRNGAPASITINDIEFALFAGAVRRYLTAAGEDPSTIHLRSLTPFAVVEEACAATRHATMLRNHWTFLFNPLPLHARDPLQRILDSHASWEKIKSTTIVPVAFALHRLSGKIMSHTQQVETNVQLATRHCVVFSNVPGPQMPVFFANREVSSVHMIYPNVGHQVGILSINGWVHMCMAMTSDRPREEARKLLPSFFEQELRDVADALGIEKALVDQGLRRL